MFWPALVALGVGAPPVDALLPDHLRPPVEEAARAELDPKRGPSNALLILQRAQRELARTPEEQMTFRLRIAAVELRRAFLAESKLDAAGRWEQALSTFSRLDLTEPGFAEWLDRALEHRADVAAELEAASGLRVAVLTRGVVARKQVQEALRRALERSRLPIQLEVVAPKEADHRLQVTTEAVSRPGGSPLLSVRATIASAGWDGPVAKQRLGTVVDASDRDAAAERGARWVARIAGRDLVARLLASRGLDMMVFGPLSGGAMPGLAPRQHDHGHH